MSDRPIVLTKHATDRAIKYDLDSQTIVRIIAEGKKLQEDKSKTKTKYVLQTKRGILVAICSECPSQITVITFTRGR